MANSARFKLLTCRYAREPRPPSPGRSYAALAHPDRVADLQPGVARLIPETGDEALSWDIAAEIIGRTG
ncbi:hypothetical protein [Nonomuraea sp. NEAU-A123]|uniref:hypothetical protein n=1 Tax=Nonomuraea sp. NEAU-A123 TaxID=2839649 RepID=UPI001BE44109|nr:hypothetical protein [Nonomuraea sp. NEAU-A123]MBT2231447.1 hypothetical protein [Nonomuraea sp. NEAU-A123]